MAKIDKTKKSTTDGNSIRPPVVTIMGHVDHGKTTLLDAIRKTNVTESEAGGITQHVGAYQTEFEGKKITFIDTPGHAAFAKMRSRGAAVTDVVVLVVAATEGVKPQTVESIKHIQNAKVPMIVAINKMDLPNADPNTVKSELAKYEVIVEDFGGKTPSVEVSATKGTNLDQLLEMILLVADMGELKSEPAMPMEGVVIESNLDQKIGTVATVLVKKGTMRVGDDLFVEQHGFRVRSMMDNNGQRIEAAGPAMPVVVYGFSSLPPVGSVVTTMPTEAKTPEQPMEVETTSEREEYEKELEALLEEHEAEEKPELKLILKADVAGTLEAITANLPDEVVVIESGVGQVGESDILMAASTGATVVAFNTKVMKQAKKLASNEGVTVKTYGVIYELLAEIEKRILKILEPTIDEEELGRAKIVEIFEMKGERIAGCKVTKGEIKKSDLIHLVRNEKILKDVRVRSMKVGKEDVDKVKSKGECGMVLEPQMSFAKDDELVAYKKLED